MLVPRPRINLILYHGVLGARAAWRADVVQRQASDGCEAGLKELAAEPGHEADPAEQARQHARGQCWASLMARTFGFDVLACPRCGGRLGLIALIEDAAVISRILRHLGVPTEIPAPRPARAPPLSRGSFQPGWVGRRSFGVQLLFLTFLADAARRSVGGVRCNALSHTGHGPSRLTSRRCDS